jgi:nucleotide-binding universal stress UspA family protein
MDAFRPKLILVATDFSKTAAHALRYASAIAERLVARLVVIYADELTPTRGDQEKLVAHVQENVSPSVPFDARVIAGSPISSIVDEAKECGADLLVMGTQGRTGVRRLIVGSVCESVMRAVPIPVIAVSMAAADHDSLAINKVVCIVDQSPECAAALRIAAAMAPDARLILLNPREEERPLQAAERMMRLRRWLPAELVDRSDLRLVDAGWTAEHLADFAATMDADLIVAGGQRGHGVSDRFRGTTTDRIIQRSECPVLVV